MVMDGGIQLKAPVIPPRELIVQKFAESRAPELESLHSTIANRGNNDFRSRRNKRRRTTSYDNRSSKTRFRKKQKVGVSNQSRDENGQKDKKAPPRHIRRRKELNNNPQSGFCTSGDGTKRLRTHVWHAKRFTMIKRWGFHLPVGLQGRGRGSRALLKWLRNGAIVHDASYYCAVQLEGSQESLLSVLSTVMAPFPSSNAEVLSGAIYANTMLHHAEAPFLGTIAPVIYMWRPLKQLATVGAESAGTHGHDDNVIVDNCSSSRLLWVWIHAAAFTEGYNALKTACDRQGKTDGAVGSVSCTSLEGRLATLEVMGSKASQLLQKILHPISSVSEKSSVFKKCSFMVADSGTPFTNASILENDEHISVSRIISLTVHDPRALTKECTGVIPDASSASILDEANEHEGHDNLAGIAERNTELDSDSTDLWDACEQLRCPVEENVLCMEKHYQRLSSFCLGDKCSEEVNASTKTYSSRFCPILLLRRNDLKDSIKRWSVVLPLSWFKALWMPLISNGARAIGLREKRWVACEAGMPNFPSDFPECSAYSSLMEAEAAAADKEASLRPSSMKPLSIPIAPPWDCVHYAFGKNPTGAVDAQVCDDELCAESEITDNLLTTSAFGDSDVEAQNSCILFKGAVARTSSMLTHFLNAIDGAHLLLFPCLRDKKTCISASMKDERRLSEGRIASSSLTDQGKRLCFLRVVVHAYKEGVIDEGAVVCAPHLADIKLWTSGSNNNRVELQVPQSSMPTYFVKQASGKWEFQVPEDPEALECNRWPIGFVTTGFVRGSKNPTAVALCEAVLLSRLRHEQWSSVPLKRRRKEIYVLVRNLRSTAYRLALATIVLEQQEQDLEYI